MTSRILPTTLFLGLFLSISSAVTPSDKKVKNTANLVNNALSYEKNHSILNDSVQNLLHTADSLVNKTQKNIEKININNKILKDYEMAKDSTKNP